MADAPTETPANRRKKNARGFGGRSRGVRRKRNTAELHGCDDHHTPPIFLLLEYHQSLEPTHSEFNQILRSWRFLVDQSGA